MAKKLIAYCGLVCSACDAYKATQKNDMAALGRVAKQWSQEYGYGDSLTAKDCICDGCTTNGRKIGHCNDCKIRACAAAMDIPNCAHCVDFDTCQTLDGFLVNVPDARTTLEAVRLTL